MAEIYISGKAGHKVFYDAALKRFILRDGEGQEVGWAASEQELLEKATRLTKSKFKSVPVLRREGELLSRGRITSVDPADGSPWFSRDDKTGWGSRSKLYRDERFFPLTPKNLEIEKGLRALVDEIDKLHKEANALAATLESPLTGDTIRAAGEEPS